MVYVAFVISACICPIAMICCCFVRISGQEFHFNYRLLCGLHAWPWNLMSRHGLRDICHFCLYLCNRNDFFVSWGFSVREFILTIATRVTLTYDLETQGHVMVYVTFVISGHLYVSYCTDFLFCQVFRSRNSFWLLPLAWPSRVTLKHKVPSWSTCFNNLTKQKVT